MRVSLKKFIVPSIPLAIFLVGCCFILWMATYVVTRYSAVTTQDTSIVESLQSIFLHNSILLNLVCIILTLLNGFLVAQINNRFTIIRTRTFLPILIFLMLIATWSQTHVMIGSHLGLTLFILALFYFFSMSRDRRASEQAFDNPAFVYHSGLLDWFYHVSKLFITNFFSFRFWNAFPLDTLSGRNVFVLSGIRLPAFTKLQYQSLFQLFGFFIA